MPDPSDDGAHLDTEVAILGGGLAGLTCAAGLAREGIDCTVVERRERLGGRARSWRDETTGDPVHIGPHIFLSHYPNMFQLLDLFGTRSDIVWQEDHFITISDGPDTFVMDQHPLPPPLHFLPSIVADDRLPLLHKLSNVPITLFAMQMDERDVLRLDDVNAYGFLRRMGVSEQYLRQFWAFTSRAIMNVPLELCSAGALLRFYRRFIGHRDFSFGFPDGGLGDLFAPHAGDFLRERGCDVRLETEAVGFATGRDGVEGLQLADGRELRAETTVAAVPPTTLRDLVPRDWNERWDVFGELGFFDPSSYISPYLWFDRKLTDLKMWARSHDTHALNCDFYDFSNILSDWNRDGSFVTSNIINSQRIGPLSDREVVERTVDEIADFLPGASMDRLEHSVVNRIPMAIHAPYPGTERRRPDPNPPVDGLLLAGDWIQTHLPSSMESACKSGWMAADQVLADRGRRTSMTAEHPDVEGLTRLFDRMADFWPPKKLRRAADTARRRLFDESPPAPEEP